MLLNGGKKGRRSGVLICGAYGHDNAGDEAILDAIVLQMRTLDPGMPLTVLSRQPKKTAERYGIRALHSFDFFAILKTMKSAKLYLNGGGSLMQDATSRRSLFYYLFTLWAAKRLGCRVIMYGCGVGPVTRAGDQYLAGRIIDRNVDVITLREPGSKEELRAWGVKRPQIIIASDPAMTLPPASEGEVDAFLRSRGIDPGGRYIGFCLRCWPGFREKAPCFTAAARLAYESCGLVPVFLSINLREDGEAADLVREGLDGPSHGIYDPLPSNLAIGILSRMTAVVSMRLHGLIFAAGQGVPLVGVSYDPKVKEFMEYLGQDLCVELEQLTPELLCTLTERAIAQYPDRKRLAEKARLLRDLEHRSAEAAARLLQ